MAGERESNTNDPGDTCCRSERLRAFFREHGLRCTRQRELIYAALAETKSHPTAEELFQAVRVDEPGLSLATVYNTLDVFTERGICRRLPAAQGNGPSRYDTDIDQHVHILLDDGRVFDVPDDLARMLEESLPPQFVADIESRLGIMLTGFHLQLSGRAAKTSGIPLK
ncbi:MAG: transcriptional repressor [Phycisphaeraceae bacterium]|nr:MAG: transcriptional repressor [Phycisphaeraceae bacterium]